MNGNNENDGKWMKNCIMLRVLEETGESLADRWKYVFFEMDF
jgi:hypothetical protein